MSETKYYKVLVEGRAPNTRTLWPLPFRSAPGEWMEVEGELVRCRNGLHLTNDPVGYKDDYSTNKYQCYLAETEGETIGPIGHELVARKVRLVKRVPWSDFKWVDPDPDVDPEPVKPVVASPAMELLAHVWKHEGHGAGQSWARLNDAMGRALKLAIVSGLRFDVGDFAAFAKDFNSSRWIGDAEWCYSRACGADHSDHGGNPSAVQSFEAWCKRKPYLVRFSPNDKTPNRLHVGARFRWWDKGELRDVHVTSFNDATQTCVAVEYDHSSSRSKVTRRHMITHDKIKAYHAEIRERTAKAKQSKDELEAVPA